jgi:hypothetical protein
VSIMPRASRPARRLSLTADKARPGSRAAPVSVPMNAYDSRSQSWRCRHVKLLPPKTKQARHCRARFRRRPETVGQRTLATAPTARGARGDRSGLELLEVLEHADHRVARSRMGLIGDRPTQADAQFGAQLGLDQAVGAKRFLGVVMPEIGLATRRGNPHRGERGSAATRLRDGKLLHRTSKPLTNQRHRRKRNQTIVVVVGPTKDRACH